MGGREAGIARGGAAAESPARRDAGRRGAGRGAPGSPPGLGTRGSGTAGAGCRPSSSCSRNPASDSGGIDRVRGPLPSASPLPAEKPLFQIPLFWMLVVGVFFFFPFFFFFAQTCPPIPGAASLRRLAARPAAAAPSWPQWPGPAPRPQRGRAPGGGPCAANPLPAGEGTGGGR